MDSARNSRYRFLIAMAIAVMLVGASTMAFGQGATTTRPISDFLSRQGTFCLQNPGPACYLFRPPVPNYVGLSGREPGEPNSVYDRFALIDYAGLANAWLVANGHASLGTQTSGTITERRLADGTVEVRVNLFTNNALAFVETCVPSAFNPCPGDPPGTPLFGYTATAVLAGAPAALADSFLQLVFINPSSGAPLPDFVELTNTGAFVNLRFLGFRASATGPLRSAFGVPNGTPGRFGVTQTGLLMLPRFQGAVSDAFPAEVMSLRVIGR